MVLLAHVSDLHLDGGTRAAERAARVFDEIVSMPGPVDVVVCTGDVAEHGDPAEYRAARELFTALPCPWLAVPGNHDRRAAFAAELLGTGVSGDGPLNQDVTAGRLQVLAVDSTVPGHDHGRLDDATLDWLDTGLGASPDVPVLVALHHPPVELSLPFVDPLRLTGAEELARTLRRHPRVVAVLCGHAHSAATTRFAGLPLVVAPGVASTVRMPRERVAPVDTGQPPGFALHELDDADRLVTHMRATC